MACLSMKIMMRISIFAWLSLAEASLKHMRAHGHDEKKSKAIEVFSGLLDFDALPPGQATMPGATLVPSKETYTMRGGYREYDGALAPPWVSASTAKTLTKARCLGFLDAADASVESARQALRKEYGGGKHAEKIFGSEGGNGGKSSSAAERGLLSTSASPEEQLAKRMANIILAQAPSRRRYTLALTGQSNAAGHGSYFDETYPFVLGRAAASAFSAAGITLAVQNFAVGGGRTLPTTGWCGSAQLGPSVDFGIWDFTMTEGGKSEVQGEAWVRSLLTLKQPPAALQFMDGKRAQRWASTYKGVVAMLGLDNPSNGLELMNNSTSLPPPLRFLHPDCKSYKAKHGDEADVLCRKDKWSPARDLMQYARNAKGAMQPAVYEKGRKVGGGCPGMNPWHDGWKLHKLKGSILAHFQLRVLSRALAMIRDSVTAAPSDGPALGASLEALRQATSRAAEPLSTLGLPHPGQDCKSVPHCGLVGQLGCGTASAPAVLPPLKVTPQHSSNDQNTNQGLLPFSLDGNNNGKKGGEATCHMGHLDHRYSVLVEPSHGWASVTLEGGLGASGALLVCEPPTGWNRDPKLAELGKKDEVQWRLSVGGDLQTMSLSNPVPIEITKSCYEFQGIDVSAAQALGGGNNGLSLQVKALSKSKAVRFDHVIWHKAV